MPAVAPPIASARRNVEAARIRGSVLGLGLVAVGLALHLPRIGRPLGLAEFNAGMACGVFARNFEKFGFGALRGVPVGHQVLDDPASVAVPYLNHPPGGYWLLSALGSHEWQLRLPTVVAHILCALLLVSLLRRSLGELRAWLAGTALLCMPVLLLDGQIAHEPMWIALCLTVFLAAGRLESGTRHRRAWLATIAAASAVGPWIDWTYGFVCLGLVPLMWSRDLRATCARIALPWTVSLVSLGLVLAWREWARHGPLLPEATPVAGLGHLARGAIFERPAAGEFLAATAHQLQQAFTTPLWILGVVGLAPFCRTAPRLCLALLIACLPTPLLFPRYTITETHYVGMLAPLVAAGAATLAFRSRPLAVALGILLAGLVLPAAFERIRLSDTTFFRDLGRVLTDAAADSRPGGERPFVVCTNFHARYGYYIETNRFWPFAVREPTSVETLRAALDGTTGLRYLWLVFRPRRGPPLAEFTTGPALDSYLEDFPRQRVAGLEGSFWLPGHARWYDLHEAWLVTVEP